MFNPQHSQDEEDKYGTVKRVVSSPQSTTVTNQERKSPTPCSLTSPLIGCTILKGPASDTNPALLNESALLIGSTLSDLSLLTNSSLFTDSSFLSHSTSLGSLCSTPTEGEINVNSWVRTNVRTLLKQNNSVLENSSVLLISISSVKRTLRSTSTVLRSTSTTTLYHCVPVAQW